MKAWKQNGADGGSWDLQRDEKKARLFQLEIPQHGEGTKEIAVILSVVLDLDHQEHLGTC